MAKIPNELFVPIVAHLGATVDEYKSRKTLGNLRNMNHYLAEIAAPYLFETVPFWLHSESLKRIHELSERPELCVAIKCLCAYEQTDLREGPSS